MKHPMSTAREDFHYGRRRSNTAQSILRSIPAPPLRYGDSKVLNAWVRDTKDKASPPVIFNHSYWPGVAEGDMLRLVASNSEDLELSFLFTVPKEDSGLPQNLQISVSKVIADKFRIKNYSDVMLTKVNQDTCCADYIEFIFQDQYLGRNDMWRLGQHLAGQCVYVDQEVTFIGSIVARINAIYIAGKEVSSAFVTRASKAIYRSLSAKITIFIQVCRELWEFAGDGERYNEKIVHSFLPTLFEKWSKAATNHIVTIVLISRVYYDESEVDYAAGPLRRDDFGKWYKDFYKVITDLEIVHEWKPTLVSLKDSFWDFQRDILLTHHYHRSHQDAEIGSPAHVRLVGQISYAHDGPILEAINLALNPTETHYIDRSLSLTGSTIILLTPGTGYFRVSKHLLRLTTIRLLDQGFGIDLVSLSKPPLHQSPIFSYQSVSQESSSDANPRPSSYSSDPLAGPLVNNANDSANKKTFWWEPFWISITFWDKQMDLPFRGDRFVGRAKMHQVQMLGLLDLDVLSSIEVPFLPEPLDSSLSHRDSPDEPPSKVDAYRFDMEIFASKVGPSWTPQSRNSIASTSSSTTLTIPYRNATVEKRNSQRNSIVGTKIVPIEESPKRIIRELPPDEPQGIVSKVSVASPATGLSASPSSSSVHSLRSSLSAASLRGVRNAQEPLRPTSLASKLAPSWLFNPFRSSPSEPQTFQVFAAGSSISPASSTPTNATPTPIPSTPKPAAKTSSPIRTPAVLKSSVAQISQSPAPVAIRPSNTSARVHISRTYEEDSLMPHRGSYPRRSPVNTPPRDETVLGKRRSAASVHAGMLASSPPVSVCNPSQPLSSAPHTLSLLARRWQHMFPQAQHKYEIKWKAMVIPLCLPLTVEHFPTTAELELNYDVFSYDFVVDPRDVRSFLVEPPAVKGSNDDIRQAWALAIMRGMAAVRLAQGFQFVISPLLKNQVALSTSRTLRRTKSFIPDEDVIPKPAGAADVLRSTSDPVYLGMSNEIHRISYTGEAIQVRRYVRRQAPTPPFDYQCLIWPKLGGGYTELTTRFSSHGFENYGWNRLDMLVAGYEHHFNESLRYWRTRFIVLPTAEPPASPASSGEKLNDEEMRILGIEKLAEQFTKLRWQPAEEKTTHPAPPVRFLQTTLNPASSVMDESLMDQLDLIHAAGPLRKKIVNSREIGEMSLAAIAKAMQEKDGVPIKNYHWHVRQYPNSFIGYDLVSWLVREFKDVSSRIQAVEWGVKLQEQGLFEHVRGQHGFLDGHYFYRLKGEHAVPSTPKSWFRRYATEDLVPRSGHYPSSVAKPKNTSPRRHKKRLILSQSMVIDIDPNKRSDQAESVILHHDLIHNPANAFHFELQWIGTTARCIEDLIRQWSRLIERYGLRLVEAYVNEISEVRNRNAFQSCFPIRLAVPPPFVMNIEKRVPEGTSATHFFEYALLRRLGYVMDVEAHSMYPEQVEVVYSYRRTPYKYSQFVHRSGAGFVQVLGGSRGFVFLTNRLMGPGRTGTTKNKELATVAEEIRIELHKFCSNKAALEKFYDEELAMLGNPAPDDPLTIIT